MERSIPTRRSPRLADLTSRQAGKRIALLGVPVEVGASQPGALMGPAALRTAGLGPLLQNLGLSVEDHGDISPLDLVRAEDSAPPNTRQYREIGAWARAVSPRAYALAGSGAVPVFLGGDHSL